MGVGFGSLAYHTSHGRWRNLGRKIDYWCIALSSIALLRATRPQTGVGILGAALVMTPFQPFVVSACNVAAVEVCAWDNHYNLNIAGIDTSGPPDVD